MVDDQFTSPGQLAILVTAFVTLVTTLATLVYQFVREGRRHRWEEEAKVRYAQATAKSESEREAISKRVEQAEVALNKKIDENTEISRRAFTEANHVNEKLVAQGLAFDKLLAAALVTSTNADLRNASSARRNDASDLRSVASELRNSDALKDVKTTVDETAGKVSDIHHAVVDDA